jgi:lipopolysaccharide/colanic/teichoic acid biosynthesis glycosyltransferase
MRTLTVQERGSRLLTVVRGLRGIYSRSEIDRIVQRETARADRTGHEFSLVLFRVKSTHRFSLSSQRLVKTVLSRVRTTDEVGWFDDRHLCALLPDTGAAGAWRFAEDVCDLISARSPRPIFVVYSYPTDWLDGPTPAPRPSETDHPNRRGTDHPRVGGNSRNDRNDRNHGGGAAGGGNGSSSASSSNGSSSTGGHARDLAAALMDDVNDEMSDGIASKRLETLLVKKMPFWKRAIDIVGALIGIVLASPFMILAIVGIKLTEPRGPIIFKQRRSGLGGRPFWIYKFRTMCVGAEKMRDELKKQSEQDGPAFKMKYDPRVTRIGRFLRKTSIDELPQLFNILKGDMALVGPRPLPISEQTACEMWQRRRLDVTPGLTCIWQVKGRSRVTFAEWMRMDLRYIRRRTLMHDVSLIMQTVKSVLLRKGAV